MPHHSIDFTNFTKNHLWEHLQTRKAQLRKDATVISPWLVPCRVKVLLVTDGGLDFSTNDFGLSAFVDCLQNDGRFYIKFDITLAHLRSNVSNTQLGSAIPGIVNRYPNFRFDNPTHFTPGMYDQVWMFGIETNFYQTSYAHRNNNRGTYPNDRLSDAELVNLSTFMNNGGGIFATGDHGFLGRALCGSVVRVRSMRLWAPNFVSGQDEVSMSGARRNDTNQIGDSGTQFSDQSDDIPQTIMPKYYYRFMRKFPHPLLCSKFGVINVLPDHPHEGECIVPSDPTQSYSFDGSVEYPLVSGTGVRVLPEIIAQSQVISGNTATLGSSAKTPTQAHDFGAISTYDGHRVGIGRVVTDATWHHFVNVNLIGIVEDGLFDDLTPLNSPTKNDGFLSSAIGMAHMARIKEYYINIGTWISPSAKIACFHSKFWWKLIYSDRIMEAALSNPDTPMSQIPINLFYIIGGHARDVLGRSASQCESWAFVVNWSKLVAKELVREIDPWSPEGEIKENTDIELPGINPNPIIDVALGAAIVALRQEFPYPPEKLDEKFTKKAEKILFEGGRLGIKLALKHYRKEVSKFSELLEKCQKEAGK